MDYYGELTRTMTWLGEKPEVVVIGQSVAYPGTGQTNQMKGVPSEKLHEMPVDEDFQVGFCLGFALDNKVPVCVIPRFDFLVVGANQMVSHVDKFKLMTEGWSQPKVIFKIGVGSIKPLFPGHQHVSNHSKAFQLMCPNIDIIELKTPEAIFPAYRKAYERVDGKSTILVEFMELY